MLCETVFNILSYLYLNAQQKPTQRQIAAAVNCSLGKVNAVLTQLKQDSLLDDELALTQAGMAALEPYRVNNAIIMAAGMSSRFAPLSYEKPKALLRVKGQLLIERQIEQLQDAGITDITIVLGYLKEQLFYLEEKYNVSLVINEDYYRYNNTSTLMRVLDKLSNTYICSSDNYFTQNPFEPFVYQAYYSAVYSEDKTDEYCIRTNKKGRICDVTIGGQASWYMLGHVYFDRAFSAAFSKILTEQYDSPQTKLGLWEDLYIRNIDKLDMYIRQYDSYLIQEFDSLDELRQFDASYITNTDSKIISNICSVLNVPQEKVGSIVPIKNGMTNLSFCFTVEGKQYVYRHPGVGTSNYINRASEAKSLDIARALGLDDTFIHMNAQQGWKISHFVQNAVTLDYHNREHVEKALGMLRTLHACDADTGHRFDIHKECLRFEELLHDRGRSQFPDMQQLHDSVESLLEHCGALEYPPCLCHCDSYDPNFLIDDEGKMFLIDWEYSGMAQRGVDIGTFIACSPYTPKQACEVIDLYLEHESSANEKAYYLSYIAVAAYYWFLWAIYQESLGNSVGEYLYIWYKYTRQYSNLANKIFMEVTQ